MIRPAGQRSHPQLAITYTHFLPSPGARLGASKHVFNNWLLSGITVFQSGSPAAPACSSYDSGVANSDPSLSGAGTQCQPWNWRSRGGGARCQAIGNPNDFVQDFDHNFNTSAFTLAAPWTSGNIGLGIMRQPGWSNWDMTLERRVRLGRSEKRMPRFCIEAYNVFNHAEFSSIGTSLNRSGGVNINPDFGAYTGTAGQRVPPFL